MDKLAQTQCLSNECGNKVFVLDSYSSHREGIRRFTPSLGRSSKFHSLSLVHSLSPRLQLRKKSTAIKEWEDKSDQFSHSPLCHCPYSTWPFSHSRSQKCKKEAKKHRKRDSIAKDSSGFISVFTRRKKAPKRPAPFQFSIHSLPPPFLLPVIRVGKLFCMERDPIYDKKIFTSPTFSFQFRAYLIE